MIVVDAGTEGDWTHVVVASGESTKKKNEKKRKKVGKMNTCAVTLLIAQQSCATILF